MSLATLRYLQCDYCGNPSPVEDTADEARRHAKQNGWRRQRQRGAVSDRMLDVCPAHPTLGDTDV